MRAAPSRRVRRCAGLQDHARCRRRLCLSHPWRSAFLDTAIGVALAACGARQCAGKVSRLCRAPERAGREAAHDSRAVPHPRRGRGRTRACADRRSRTRRKHREAVLDRRDVVRLDLARGAHDARDRDESHRRQVEYRRGRRGIRSL